LIFAKNLENFREDTKETPKSRPKFQKSRPTSNSSNQRFKLKTVNSINSHPIPFSPLQNSPNNTNPSQNLPQNWIKVPSNHRNSHRLSRSTSQGAAKDVAVSSEVKSSYQVISHVFASPQTATTPKSPRSPHICLETCEKERKMSGIEEVPPTRKRKSSALSLFSALDAIANGFRSSANLKKRKKKTFLSSFSLVFVINDIKVIATATFPL
jgi:hypothetical protein